MAADNVQNNNVEDEGGYVEDNEEEQMVTWTEWLALEKEFMESHPNTPDTLDSPEWKELMKKMPRPWDYELPNTLTKEGLEELAEVLEWIGNYDPETSHSLEDKARKMFICEVADGKLTPEETVEMAKILKRISEIRFSRWCA